MSTSVTDLVTRWRRLLFVFLISPLPQNLKTSRPLKMDGLNQRWHWQTSSLQNKGLCSITGNLDLLSWLCLSSDWWISMSRCWILWFKDLLFLTWLLFCPTFLSVMMMYFLLASLQSYWMEHRVSSGRSCFGWFASDVSFLLHNDWLGHSCVASNIQSYSCSYKAQS